METRAILGASRQAVSRFQGTGEEGGEGEGMQEYRHEHRAQRHHSTCAHALRHVLSSHACSMRCSCAGPTRAPPTDHGLPNEPVLARAVSIGPQHLFIDPGIVTRYPNECVWMGGWVGWGGVGWGGVGSGGVEWGAVGAQTVTSHTHNIAAAVRIQLPPLALTVSRPPRRARAASWWTACDKRPPSSSPAAAWVKGEAQEAR